MKRTIAFLSVILIMFVFVGCGGGDEEYSYDQNKNQSSNYSELSTSNSDKNISFQINGDVLSVSGVFSNDIHKSVMVVFDKQSDAANTARVVAGRFSIDLSIPQKETVLVELYGGKEQYGTYESIILDFVKINNNNGKWSFVESPVLGNNISIFEKEKNGSDFLDATEHIQSNDAEIVNMSNSITAGITDEYEKVRAIHDWVAENIYYDFDALNRGVYDGMDAKNVYTTRKGVCEGYANLMAALIRCQGIPCRVQSGYALGIGVDKEWTAESINTNDGNHAWNEVYVNGRWIVVDATWDSQNKYIDGRYEQGQFITDIYFDSTQEFFALSHKLIEN